MTLSKSQKERLNYFRSQALDLIREGVTEALDTSLFVRLQLASLHEVKPEDIPWDAVLGFTSLALERADKVELGDEEPINETTQRIRKLHDEIQAQQAENAELIKANAEAISRMIERRSGRSGQ